MNRIFRMNGANRVSCFQATFWVALGLLTLGIPGCKKQKAGRNSSDDPSGSAALSATGSLGGIRIGEVGSMTGPDATFGISTHRGILLAVNEINAKGGVLGRNLELISMDDQGKSSEAVIGITNLITQQHVQAVLGEVASSISLAMAPIAQQYGIPMISPSSINTKLTQQGDSIFRICFVDRFQSQVMADFALNTLHAKRAAILRDVKSDYSRDSAEIFAELFKKGGGEIVADQSYSGGDIDFKSQLTSIRSTHPDILLVPGYYTEIGLIARQRKDLGISAPMLGGDGWDSPKLKEIGGEALNGSYFVSHFSQDDPAKHIQEFIHNYKTTYQVGAPDGLAALGYDAARLLADALKRAKSLSPEDLRAAIASTRGFLGVTGTISIGPDRNAVKSAVIFKLSVGGDPKAVKTWMPHAEN